MHSAAHTEEEEEAMLAQAIAASMGDSEPEPEPEPEGVLDCYPYTFSPLLRASPSPQHARTIRLPSAALESGLVWVLGAQCITYTIHVPRG